MRQIVVEAAFDILIKTIFDALAIKGFLAVQKFLNGN